MTTPGRSSGVAITTCACGREYNSARLGSCPACGRPSEGQRWSTPLNGTQVRDTSDDDRRKRRRPWIIGGLAGGLLAVVIAGFLVSRGGSSPDSELSAPLVREVIGNRDIPCDEADVGYFSGAVDYECSVAGRTFRIVIEEEGTSNALTREFESACSFSDQFQTLVGANWRAASDTPLVDLATLQEAFGGIVTTGDRVCPIVLRMYYPSPRSQWAPIFAEIQRLEQS